jgi:hypothetical protein
MSEMNVGLLKEFVLTYWLADAVKLYRNGNKAVRKRDAIVGFNDKKSARNWLIRDPAFPTRMQRVFVEYAVFLYDVVINAIPESQDTP